MLCVVVVGVKLCIVNVASSCMSASSYRIVVVVVVVVVVQELKALVDRKTGKRVSKHPRFVKQDQIVIAILQTAGVICMETFKDFPPMARFTLRDEGMWEGLVGGVGGGWWSGIDEPPDIPLCGQNDIVVFRQDACNREGAEAGQVESKGNCVLVAIWDRIYL